VINRGKKNAKIFGRKKVPRTKKKWKKGRISTQKSSGCAGDRRKEKNESNKD